MGQLVTRKLRNRPNKNYRVCVVAREAARAKELLQDEANGEVEVMELNLVGENKVGDDQLRAVMRGKQVLLYVYD